MKEKIFHVKGMHCKSCEMLIGDSLEELGVNNFNVSSKAGVVKVRFDESKIGETEIIKAIEEEGYKVK